MSKTLAGATTTHFTWGLDGEVLAESNGQGQPLTEIIRLDGQPVAVVSGGALAQIHTDHLGTPQAATDAASAVTWSRAFRPFGEETAATGTLVLNLRFPGQWLDAESGYQYNVFRDYDPSTGRYIQSDPIGLRGGWNTYAYVGGKPLSCIDPRGLEVYICRRSADLPFPLNLLDHNWIKTDTLEAGMGGMRGGIPAQGGNSDAPYDQTQTIDHSGQSRAPNSSCEKQRNVVT